VAKHWQLPPKVAAAARRHHDDDNSDVGVAAVQLADALAHEALDGGEPAPLLALHAVEVLGVYADALAALRDKLQDVRTAVDAVAWS
jgi:HD-like signal output (HDOD) protein